MKVTITEKDKLRVSSLFSKEYYELVHLSKEYVLYLVVDVLRNLNVIPLIKSGFVSVEEIIRKFKFADEARIPLSWFLSYLYTFGYLERKRKNRRFSFKIRKDLPEIDPDEIINKMLTIDRKVLPSNLLLERAAQGYPDYFQGKKTAIDILFTSDKMKLWKEYFSNQNIGYVVYNSFATYALLKWLPDREGLKILEVGGGTGSASINFMNELHKRGLTGNVQEFIFSDISPILLRAGNMEMMRYLPETERITLKTLDFNKPLTPQGIKANSLDVVYGVNSIHVATDLEVSLGYVYDVLKPGGLLVLSECVRPSRDGLLFQELIFNLLDDYRDVRLSDIRPMPGFLDVSSWKKLLEEMRFKNVEFLTNTDCDYPEDTEYANEVFAMIMKGVK